MNFLLLWCHFGLSGRSKYWCWRITIALRWTKWTRVDEVDWPMFCDVLHRAMTMFLGFLFLIQWAFTRDLLTGYRTLSGTFMRIFIRPFCARRPFVNSSWDTRCSPVLSGTSRPNRRPRG